MFKAGEGIMAEEKNLNREVTANTEENTNELREIRLKKLQELKE